MGSYATAKNFAIKYSGILDWSVSANFLSLSNQCNWVVIPLCRISALRSEIATCDEIDSRSVLLLDRISFEEGKIYAGSRTSTKMTQHKSYNGDIVVSKINARKGAIGIADTDKPIGVTVHFRVLIPDIKIINNRFLWLALRSIFCRNQFEIATGGQGKGEISEARLMDVKVPFPPLPVQQSIVEHWHKAQDAIDITEERIHQMEQKIAGRFFSDLGLMLLKPIENLKVFAIHWKEFERWSVSYSQTKRSMVDLALGKYPVVDLSSLLEMVQYGTSEKAHNDKIGTPVIRMNNIIEGELDLSNLKYIRLPEKNEMALLLKDGDILFNRTNSKELVGKCAVFHEIGNYVFASYLIRICADKAKAIHDYLSFFINSPIGRRQIDALSRQIIGQANINSQELRSLQIPLPPIEIQHDIMDWVKEKKAEIDNERKSSELLRQKTKIETEEMILGIRPVEGIQPGSP
jgi:type I restriction enzyme S subunit